MKKVLLIVGIIMLSIGVICFVLSLLFYWASTSFLDGTAELYARLFARSRTFLFLGTGLSLSGIGMLMIHHFIGW